MKFPLNNTIALADFSLSLAAQAQVRLAAQTAGNQLTNVEEIARADVRAAQHGGCPLAGENLKAAQRKKGVEQKNLAAAERRVRHADAKVIVKGQRHPMGLIGWLMILVLLVGLLAALWVENGAASQALLSVGAWDVDTIEKARMIMLTPVVVGIALVLGFKVLPVFIRRPFFIGACCLLGMLFLTWAACFAIQSEKFRNDSGKEISLSDEWTGEEAGDEGASTEGGWSAWLMFGCLTSIMCLTTFIGHAGVEHVVHRYETWTTNDDHTRALDDVKVHENEIGRHEKEIARLTKELADMKAEEDRAVVQARTLYLKLSQCGDISPGSERPADGPVSADLKPHPVSPAPGNAAAMPALTPFRDQAA